MPPQYNSLRGMPDILPEDAALMRWVEDTAQSVFDLFGFSEIRTPLLEETEVFTRSIGQDTDIVQKEMYSFTDRGGKNISLRPEGTASIIRAYIEHGWNNEKDLVKVFYSGPMFRGERPQKGRLRQFHQIGAETIGGSGPLIDAEMIFSLDVLLRELKISGFTILLNSLGCPADRDAYKKELSRYLEKKSEGLCEDCRKRAGTNVLRVLDCKREACKEAVKLAPSILEKLCGECRRDFEELKKALGHMGISFTEKPDLVRGLDYYTGTIFEVVHQALGSQDAVAAGGRYDGLTKQMGGADAGAIGYAIGVERLLLLVDRAKASRAEKGVLVIPADDGSRECAFGLSNKLRMSGVACETDLLGRSLKSLLRKANKESRRFVVIIGEEERKSGKLVLKNMETGEQQSLSFEEIVAYLKT